MSVNPKFEFEDVAQVAGKVVTDLWWDWRPSVELYNVNVPLGFRDEKGQRVEPEVIFTAIDRASYTSLYSTSRPFIANFGEHGILNKE